MKKLSLIFISLFLGLNTLWAHNFEMLLYMSATPTSQETYALGAVQNLGFVHNFNITVTSDPIDFNTASLDTFEVVLFLNRNGSSLNAVQKLALESFIADGKGFVGIKGAANSVSGWPWYSNMLGASIANTTGQQTGTVKISDGKHPSGEGIPRFWATTDVWCNFQNNPRDSVHVIATLDENTIAGGTNGYDHPLTWCRDYRGGRVWFTGMGGSTGIYNDSHFQDHLTGGIEWAAGVVTGDAGATLIENYDITTLDNSVTKPMQLDVAPDGRVFFVEKDGIIKIFKPSISITVTGAAFPSGHVYFGGENGLIGMVLAPGFGTGSTADDWIYLHYSFAGTDPFGHTGTAEMRVSRCLVSGDVVNLASEEILLTYDIDREAEIHSSGGLQFDSNGNLFISTGDNTAYDTPDQGYAPLDERPGREINNAQRTSGNTDDLRGKILRITPSATAGGGYTVPTGNLFPATDSTRSEIYIMGVRNPFRFSVDPVTGWLYWGDIGPDAVADHPLRGPRGYDEYNQAKVAGNYGWPYVSGPNLAFGDHDFTTSITGPKFDTLAPVNYSPGLTGMKNLPPSKRPLMWMAKGMVTPEFPEFEGGTSVTAIAGPIYRYDSNLAATDKLPAYFDQTLFVIDWSKNWVKEAKLDAQGKVVEINPFLPSHDWRKAMDMKIGPDGLVYVLEWGTDWNGNGARITRIRYTPQNRPPVAVINTDKNSGPIPLQVQFDGSGSYDPIGGGALTYSWKFGDGDSAMGANVSHTYTVAGDYQATLTVTNTINGKGLSSTSIHAGNTAPVVTIISPLNGGFYDWGDNVSYEVSVVDAEDGSTGGGQINCNTLFHQTLLGHDEHAHPSGLYTGCTGTFQPNNGHGDEDNIFFLFEASYTDQGATGVNPITGTTLHLIHSKLKQAEFGTYSQGVATAPTLDQIGREDLIGIDDGDYIAFAPMNLNGITNISFRVSSNGPGGKIELFKGDPGDMTNRVNSVDVLPTGGWGNYTDVLMPVVDPVGTDTFYFVFTNPAQPSNLFYLNWIHFLEAGESTFQLQQITFPALADVPDTTEFVLLQATASSGLPIAYTLISGPGTVSNDTLFLTGGTGQINIRASQPGDTVYLPADDVSRTFAVLSTGGGPIGDPVYLNAGGLAYTGANGVQWGADQYFTGGFAFSTPQNIASTPDPTLFQSERVGGLISYELPITADADYTLQLHFAEIYFAQPGQRVFDVYVEGQLILDDLDVFEKAGAFTPFIHQMTLTGPADSTLEIQLVPLIDGPKISAISLLPLGGSGPQPQTITFPQIADVPDTISSIVLQGSTNSGLPITYTVLSGPATVSGNTLNFTGANGLVKLRATQYGDSSFMPAPLVNNNFTVFPAGGGGVVGTELYVNAGGPEYMATDSTVWIADQYGTGGWTFITTQSISQTPDTALYQSERVGGAINYLLPITANAPYILELHFAEIYFTDPGERIFDIFVDGQLVMNDLDIYAQVGGFTPFVFQMPIAGPVGGILDVQLVPVLESPKISALALIPLTGGGSSQQLQTITFPALPDVADSIAFVVPQATASSGLPVTYSLVSGPATLSGDTLYLAGTPGDVTVRASQAGDSAYFPAYNVDRTFSVLSSDGDGGLYVNAGGGNYIASDSTVWLADQYGSGGWTFTTSIGISQTPDPVLYQSERVGGAITYFLPLTAFENYDLQLHFAEIFFTGTGERLFDIKVNGKVVVEDFDIVSQAGSFAPYIFQMPVTGPASGILEVNLVPVLESPKISALALIPSDGSGPQFQSISFDAIPDQNVTNPSLKISATASSGLPVSFAILSGPATISGDSVFLTGTTGTVTIQASQAGDSVYAAAASFNRSFKVNETTTVSYQTISQVSSASDDAEENLNSLAVTNSSSDLELGYDGSRVQIVGLRFPNHGIPAGAVITSAYIQFTTDEPDAGATNLTIYGEAVDNAGPFYNLNGSISSRPKTTANATWSPAPWLSAGNAGTDQLTTDISAVIQEIIDRPGWIPLNAISILIDGTGERTAEPYRPQAPGDAPKLIVNYEVQEVVVNQAPVAVLDATPESGSIPLSVDFDAGNSTDSDGTIVSYDWNFGEGTTSTAISPTHLYNQPGNYNVSLHVTDEDGATDSAFTSILVVDPNALVQISSSVAFQSDDAEENLNNGFVSTNSSDLELANDGTRPQVVGIRFTNVGVPQGSAIASAYVQFTVDETDSSPVALTISGVATDNALTFFGTNSEISSKPKTTANASWSPAAWNTVGAAGPDQQTSNIASIIQEIVNRPGWQQDNALTILIEGTGTRTAESYGNNPSIAPKIFITYEAEGGLPNATPVAVLDATPESGSVPLLVVFDAENSTDNDGTITGYDWDLGDGTTDTTSMTTHVYTLPGMYPVTLIVTDNEGASDTATTTVTVIDTANIVQVSSAVSQESDDAEENIGSGFVSTTSSDLELGFDGSRQQVVGIRFNGLAIPPGATISNAYVQFIVDEPDSDPTFLNIRGQASDNALTFQSVDYDITSRPQTTAVVNWAPAPWLVTGDAGTDQQTPNIASVIQEIVDRPGWTASGSLALLIDGTGERTAEDYKPSSPEGAVLHISYVPPSGPSSRIARRIDAEFYPNPFDNEFHIRVKSQDVSWVDVRVTNVLGQTIVEAFDLKTDQLITIGADLPSGVYIVQITSGDRFEDFKIVKK